MITEKELKECELVHDHGGIGWVMVENLDSEWCRITGLSLDAVGKQAFLAWKKKLHPMTKVVNDVRITCYVRDRDPRALDALTAMRNALLSGTKKVVATHIVNA